MSKQSQLVEGIEARDRLVAGMPVTERRLDLAGVATAVLEGGDGPPVILLHGPGEAAVGWERVIPQLVEAHRVIVPDLPGHGASTYVADGPLDAARVLEWLGELVDSTCTSPPALVGRTVGGAIGARFTSDHGSRVDRLVLVDTLGLADFRPSPRFELAMTRFLADPTEHSLDRFMAECLFDSDRVRDQMGELWDPLVAYAIDLARTPSVQAATGALLVQFGVAPMSPEVLERISVPTTLIWGRHDLATPLAVAETASARYGWPLHVIDDAGDDPTVEQPEAFLSALDTALGGS
jgi:pimeloyl-ACP methyl ester carboxylesterase